MTFLLPQGQNSSFSRTPQSPCPNRCQPPLSVLHSLCSSYTDLHPAPEPVHLCLLLDKMLMLSSLPTCCFLTGGCSAIVGTSIPPPPQGSREKGHKLGKSRGAVNAVSRTGHDHCAHELSAVMVAAQDQARKEPTFSQAAVMDTVGYKRASK